MSDRDGSPGRDPDAPDPDERQSSAGAPDCAGGPPPTVATTAAASEAREPAARAAGGGDGDLIAKIKRLKDEQKEMRSERQRVARELKNAERRKSRLNKKSEVIYRCRPPPGNRPADRERGGRFHALCRDHATGVASPPPARGLGARGQSRRMMGAPAFPI